MLAVLLLALDAVVILLLLYQVLVRLRIAASVAALARAARRLRNVLFVIEVGPVVIVFALVAVFATAGDPLARASHAVMLLGLWLALALGGFLCVLAVLVRPRLLLLALPAVVLALIPIVALTPLPHYVASTTGAGLIALLPVGVALVVLCYLLLIRSGRLLAADRA